ncbi:MAG: hypothetical protein AB7V43_19230 [Acidimicrobiia bacterium]
MPTARTTDSTWWRSLAVIVIATGIALAVMAGAAMGASRSASSLLKIQGPIWSSGGHCGEGCDASAEFNWALALMVAFPAALAAVVCVACSRLARALSSAPLVAREQRARAAIVSSTSRAITGAMPVVMAVAVGTVFHNPRADDPSVSNIDMNDIGGPGWSFNWLWASAAAAVTAVAVSVLMGERTVDTSFRSGADSTFLRRRLAVHLTLAALLAVGGAVVGHVVDAGVPGQSGLPGQAVMTEVAQGPRGSTNWLIVALLASSASAVALIGIAAVVAANAVRVGPSRPQRSASRLRAIAIATATMAVVGASGIALHERMMFGQLFEWRASPEGSFNWVLFGVIAAPMITAASVVYFLALLTRSAAALPDATPTRWTTATEATSARDSAVYAAWFALSALLAAIAISTLIGHDGIDMSETSGADDMGKPGNWFLLVAMSGPALVLSVSVFAGGRLLAHLARDDRRN